MDTRTNMAHMFRIVYYTNTSELHVFRWFWKSMVQEFVASSFGFVLSFVKIERDSTKKFVNNT
jgi:hypothetical protein